MLGAPGFESLSCGSQFHVQHPERIQVGARQWGVPRLLDHLHEAIVLGPNVLEPEAFQMRQSTVSP